MHDIVVIGGGIVGLATALAIIEKFPNTKLLVLEKERDWALHQTGRNSGVIHSGIYYKPGSLKARLCREGAENLKRFCETHGVAYELCGKVIVATHEKELPALQALADRARDNHIEARSLDRNQLREIEPHAEGVRAIQIPTTGIVNYRQVALAIVDELKSRGVELAMGSHAKPRVDSNEVVVSTSDGDYPTRFVVNCGGLHSDHIARQMGLDPGAKIVPFRGEYYTLRPERTHLVQTLIYPVPNPDFPFLGVHFTKMINGEVHAGPNAVLSFKREGYTKTALNLRDLADVVTYGSFWKLVARHWKEAAQEYYRSISKAQFTRSLQALVPDISANDLVPSAAGVRAQALGPGGRLIDDFLIVGNSKSMHVCNAPSPAATASLSIGRFIANELPKYYLKVAT